MNTITRGNAAEAALLNALVSVDFGVYIPFGGGHPFDLIAVLPDDRLVRVQVKSGRLHNQSIEFNSASTDHGHGRQHYRDRADMFGVHALSAWTDLHGAAERVRHVAWLPPP